MIILTTMAIMVTGGAGYIGSHAVKTLIERGEEVVVVDNLQTGYEKAIHPSAKFYKGDIKSKFFLECVFEAEQIDGVIHFAADSLVGESVTNPIKYFENNVYGTSVLLEAMVKYGVDAIVFSSTAATYGEPIYMPIDEDHPTIPINPYGASKMMSERFLADLAAADAEFEYVALRYFNVAGADPKVRLGQDYKNPTHLITRALKTALGVFPKLQVYGTDYPTVDGTCLGREANLSIARLYSYARPEDRVQVSCRCRPDQYGTGDIGDDPPAVGDTRVGV